MLYKLCAACKSLQTAGTWKNLEVHTVYRIRIACTWLPDYDVINLQTQIDVDKNKEG